MSNMTLFKSGSVIPDYLRDASDATTKEIAGSSGGKQISIKGGVWRMVVGGEERRPGYELRRAGHQQGRVSHVLRR
jgi:hypothetical protein